MEMDEITEVLAQAKTLAKTYRRRTGKPLGITGEVAEFEAARILGLELAGARQSGYDATRTENGKVTKIQIKGRCIPAKSRSGQRLGRLQFDKEWDAVLLVLMDEDYEVLSIFEAQRRQIENVLFVPGSQATNLQRGFPVRKFKEIGHQVWERS